MKNIGAEAARWAGLLMDLNSKYRAGQLTADQLWRFINLSPEAREERFGNIHKKFELLVDLGIITVPEDYVPESKFAGGNFSNPSRIIKPGDKLWVRAHKQVVGGTTTSEERMAFLATLGSHFTGAQGALLVFEQRCNQLPKGHWYGSFDDPKRLWEDVRRGDRRVPEILAYGDGGFHFHLCKFSETWCDFHAFLSFCDEPAPAGE